MYIRHGRGRKKTGSHVTADDKTEYESAITRSSRVILFGVRGSEIAGDANLTDTFPLRGDRKAANGRFLLLTKIYYV